MSPIQQMLLGVGAVATKTYVDDVFSTFLYKGSSSTGNAINNGIDLAGEKGLVWLKSRGDSMEHYLFDTVRGATKYLNSASNNAEGTASDTLTSFNNNGFTLSDNGAVNSSSRNFASWNFRKAPGFFDVVTYTGNGSNRTIAHSLGSIPGMVIVKRTDTSDDWFTYHRELTTPGNRYIRLNNTSGETSDSGGAWNSTVPTSTTFSIGTDNGVNANGGTYVAYVFAGGESTAATARSVDFDGSGDYLSLAATSDFAFGTGAYTVEFWVKPDTISENKTFFNVASSGGFAVVISSSKVAINGYSVGDKLATSTGPVLGQWTHYALVREGTGSNQTKIYKNGVLEKTGTDSTDWTTTATTGLGANASNGNKAWDGEISNFRVVKGTAVYTSSFRPPTEPLTNITNTKLLCCNDSSTTGSSVTPGTITANGNPTASSDSPFDDPAGFKFGDAGDQNVIKCGSYIGNESTDGPEINLGWEPQWVLVKNTTSAVNWRLQDSMRGIVTGGDDPELEPNTSSEEDTSNNRIDLTPTGFKVTTESSTHNNNGHKYVYICIRRPDGYVGKPVELGTGVFAMDTGNSSSNIPAMDTGFPVDFGLAKKPATTDNWRTGGRLTGTKALYTNATDAQSNHVNQVWDSNVGFWKSIDSSFQAWAWKRHAGFDVVAYTGDLVAGRQISHSLNKIPEMLWVKRRSDTGDWLAWHKGLNGGTNSGQYYVRVNSGNAESSASYYWNNTTQNSTSHFTLGGDASVNGENDTFIAMLFASVDGISKVGYYDGSDSEQEISTGFSPRFVVIKCVSQSGDGWYVMDTTRGWGSGTDKYLDLQSSGAQGTYDMGAPTSTGFTVPGNRGDINDAGHKYIYYAHA